MTNIVGGIPVGSVPGVSGTSGLAAATGQALRGLAQTVPKVVSGVVVSDSAPPGDTLVRLDVDSSGAGVIPAPSLVGPLPRNARVFVLLYPPRGALVVGPTVPTPPTPPTPDSGWISVASFLNGWLNFGGGWQVASYRKIGNQVFLRGLVKNGTIGTAAFSLPVDYRPLSATMLVGLASSLKTDAGPVVGAPSPNLTGAASAGTVHTHSLSGHNHATPILTVTNVGARMDVSAVDGSVTLYPAVASYFGIWGSFFVD